MSADSTRPGAPGKSASETNCRFGETGLACLLTRTVDLDESSNVAAQKAFGDCPADLRRGNRLDDDVA